VVGPALLVRSCGVRGVLGVAGVEGVESVGVREGVYEARKAASPPLTLVPCAKRRAAGDSKGVLAPGLQRKQL
jgi:hypothetical protein